MTFVDIPAGSVQRNSCNLLGAWIFFLCHDYLDVNVLSSEGDKT